MEKRLGRNAWVLLAIVLSGITGGSFAQAAASGQSLRPPAVPLVTHDPYFSIWSPADKLTDADTVHWTGKPHRLTSLVRLDGRTFRLMGKEPASWPALPQVGLEVLPTSTVYSFEGEGVKLTLTFTSPALPDDIGVLARPLTYVTYRVSSTDAKPHQVAFYFEAHSELVVHEPGQVVTWSRADVDQATVLKVGTKDQPVLARKGDDVRIDWGQLYLAIPNVMHAVPLVLASSEAHEAFASSRESATITASNPLPARDAPVLAVSLSAGLVRAEPVTRWLMLAYDDEFSIRYFNEHLRPYWRRDGSDAAELIRRAVQAHDSLLHRCEAFDAELMADLRNAGGAEYAQLCALAYRQTLAGNKIVVDANGQPLMFPKENFSNGCIGTVDVLFPQAPFFLTFSKVLTKAMLAPVLEYASSPRWPYAYAPHDLGTYPHATGQVYGMGGTDGDRMPVEESGNMLIMLAALAKSEGSVEFARPYWLLLQTWADYLVSEGLDPKNQLCSADMFGHLPRVANLALKAIIAIGGFGQLCEAADQPEQAKKYLGIAREYAGRWLELAQGEGRTRLAYDLPNSWGMKHNLIWDRVLGLNLFPETVGDAEIAWYFKVQNRYGLPVDHRTDTCLIDWALWSIAPARRESDFQALLHPLWRYVNETPSRVPMSDWFITTTGERKGFQARPVVGGIFVKMLADPQMSAKWSVHGGNVQGRWAPVAIPPPRRMVVPSGQQAPVRWRYTLEEPSKDWFTPGFDDSNWKEGPAGFGTQGTPGAVIRTEWSTKRIWLRQRVTLPGRPLNNPRLLLIYDEDPTVYLNGVLAASLTGWTTAYDEAGISPAAAATLKPGTNLVAVCASQTYGGQSIDVGLVEEGEPLPVRMLFNHPVRDTSICLGPDGMYYLTGTTASKTGGPEVKDGWWYVNEGIRVWKSPDLTNWTALGLVWSFEKDGTWQKNVRNHRRALWAPDIHYLRGTFWLTYCLNWPGGGTGLLKSRTGKAEGPYLDVNPEGPITPEIDASLFQDDDGKVYFVFQNGKVARMRDDMTGLAETPRLLKPANAKYVGFEGAFLTKINGRYALICAEFNARDGIQAYDCMVAHADNVYGPYSDRYLAIPHAGHNMFFKDQDGTWWATFFGNDALAPWRERPGILPIELGRDGRVQPKTP